jgi:hypothetical protein
MARGESVAVEPSYLAQLLEASLDPRQNKEGKFYQLSNIF